MMNRPHHFGITVSDAKQSRRFYHRVLRLPLLGVTRNKGPKHDNMYRLQDSVNEVTWYQFQDQGLELFRLPRHPARDTDPAPFAKPGWRYAAFTVRGFDDYAERLEHKGAAPLTAETAEGRCALVRDPDGTALVFFEDLSGNAVSLFDFTGGVGAVTGIREAGLVVADPEPYVRFFDAACLLKRDAPETHEFIPALFEYNGAIKSEVFGCIRVITLPDENIEKPTSMFPHSAQENIDYFPDLGLKHICYYCEEIQGFHTRASTSGIHFLFEPVRIAGGARMCYFSDPEGHVIEAMQVPEPARTAAKLGGRLRQSQMDAFSFVRRKVF